MNLYTKEISDKLSITEKSIDSVLNLTSEGNTIPFIARYRKEQTNDLDEVQIKEIIETNEYFITFYKRKEDIHRLISEQGKMDEEIEKALNTATKLSQLEEIYSPYKQKRKTRASEAIRKGLQPLTDIVRSGKPFEHLLSDYLNEELVSVDEVIQGVKDIIAEQVSKNVELRQAIRDSFVNYGNLETKLKDKALDEKETYKIYYEFSKKIKYLAPYQIMAINRAEKEEIITVDLVTNDQYLITKAERIFLTRNNVTANEYIKESISDSFKRLIYPSIKREIRNELTQVASDKSIDVFASNLESLLSQPPLSSSIIMGLDPAFRTGCKIAIINSVSKVLKIGVIYPHLSDKMAIKAEEDLVKLIKEYDVETIAIGNGTASRETELFVAGIISKYDLNTAYTIVSEAGASVYSASELAREEFPDFEVQERSAVSIARRLLDPLAELIKIEPKAIGVGQYQHDLPPKRLDEQLDFVLSKVVNRVGVDVNRASVSLLVHVSGLNKKIAQEIIKTREKKAIKSRQELLKIKGVTEKVFRQAGGFLKVKESKELLDQTFIHPDNYEVTHKIMEHLSFKDFNEAYRQVSLESLKEFDVDSYTLKDILEALSNPLRDYRDTNAAPILRKDVLSFDDLEKGMVLEGIVRNILDFGAFVDIGLKSNGLIHISKLSRDKISHPFEVVSVGDLVKTTVIDLDVEKQQVKLSLID